MTRGGRNTKIHAIVDGLGNPLYVQLTGGQISDITAAYELLEHVDVSGSIVMADKAYETGIRMPSYDVLINVSKVFKVSTDFLLGLEKKREIDLSGLTDAEIGALMNLIKAMKQR